MLDREGGPMSEIYLRRVGTMCTVTAGNGAQRDTGSCVSQGPVAPELIGYASCKGAMMCIRANIVDAFLLRRERIVWCQWQRGLKYDCLSCTSANQSTPGCGVEREV
jgi:hypothetical protein